MTKPPAPPKDGTLNPRLRPVENTSRDTETPTPAPIDSASVQREEGRGWPVVWLAAAVLCLLVAVYLLLF